MVTIDIEDQVMDIEDIGVTLRTLLAVAAKGYAQTNKRRWGIRYKNAVIGNVQVQSNPKPGSLQASPMLAGHDKDAVITNIQDASIPRPESLQASPELAGLEKNAVITNVQVASSHRPGSLQASLKLVGLA